MRTRPHRYALASQLSLAVFIGVCVAVHPGLVLKWNEAGLSNYGVHLATIVPYSLAFALSAFFALGAARSLHGDRASLRALRVVLRAYALLSALALVSTYGYTIHPTLHHVHVVVGITLMLFEPAVSVWLFLRLRGHGHDGYWLAVELAGLVVAVIDYEALLHVLFLAQVLTGVGFGVLLVHGVRHLEVARR